MIIKYTTAIFSLFLILNIQAQSTYRRVYRPTVPVKDPNQVHNLPKEKVDVKTQYYDNLGRPIQSIHHNSTPQGNSVIQHYQYDNLGRQPKSFMPYPHDSHDGQYRPNAAQEHLNYYNQHFDNQGQYAHTRKVYDNSPLNQVTEVYPPGKYWQTNRKTVKTQQLVSSTADSIPKFDGTTFQGYWNNAYLITQTTDADGHVTRVFCSTAGQIRARQSQIAAGQWATTYYLYDIFGQVKYVIPPEGFQYLKTHNWTWNADQLAKWIYRYTYDGRRRLKTRHLPGKAREDFVYDKRDRLVFSQDGKLRTDSLWHFTHYDHWDRPVFTALYETSQTRADLQTDLENSLTTARRMTSSSTWRQSFGPIVASAYEGKNLVSSTSITLKSGFSFKATADKSFSARIQKTTARMIEVDDKSFDIDDNEILTFHYYDNYDSTTRRFTSRYNAYLDPAYATPDTANGRIKLLPTVDRARVLGTNFYLESVTFYDDKQRVLQVHTQNHMGAWDIRTMQYNFAGDLVAEHWHHKTKTGDSLELSYRYRYDHQGRLLEERMQIDNTGWEVLAEYDYNELGQLAKKTLGNGFQEQTFDYNIRGWSLGMNDPANPSLRQPFGYRLHYQTRQTGGTGYASGQISSQSWGTWRAPNLRHYDYTYDGLGRLKQATYTGLGNENYSVRNIAYDLQGNIRRLDRWGVVGKTAVGWEYNLLDGLAYHYDGNRLTSVSDRGDRSGFGGSFKDRSMNPDYKYDVNGNLTRDLNKNIVNIASNHLDLPEVIKFGDGNLIQYGYDASGVKLFDLAYGKSDTVRRDYLRGAVYVDDSLEFIGTSVGRVLWLDGRWVHEYHHHDQLGNLRLAVRKPDTATYLATMEDMTEARVFQNWYETHAYHASFHGNSSHLNAGAGKSIGLYKSLKVNAGDRLDLKVFYTLDWATADYETRSSPPATVEVSLGDQGSGGEQTVVGVGNPDWAGDYLSSSYMMVLYWDSAGAMLPETSVAYLLFHPPIGRLPYVHGFLSVAVPVGADSVSVYLANQGNVDVYFDDFSVKHIGSGIVQEQHYYPFGMSIVGLEKRGSPQHRFLFNSIEHDESFDLNISQALYRSYDNTLGR